MSIENRGTFGTWNVEVKMEKDNEQYLRRSVENLGGLCYKFVSPGKSGVPDRLILWHGLCIFVELKDSGKKPRPLQVHEMAKIRNQGFSTFVIDSKERVDLLIDWMQKK